MNHYMVITVGVAVLFAGGCGKKEDPKPAAPQPSLMQPGDPLPPSVPTPPPPAPNVPKGPAAPLPQAGQAGDHSSPAFKEGGTPDMKK